MTEQLCGVPTRKGTPCPNKVRAGKSRCWAHDEDLADVRRKGNGKGGQNRANLRRTIKRAPSDVQDVLKLLFATLKGLSDGTVEAQQANAIANVSRAVCSAWEVGALERQLADMEKALAERPRPVPTPEPIRKDRVA
jgi:hypothetical protein